jgi:hypothetical protein
VTDTHDPWGPYRATIEDHLDTCGDYLDRLRRSLAGEIAPDRHYFADKAHHLHTAARRMVRSSPGHRRLARRMHRENRAHVHRRHPPCRRLRAARRSSPPSRRPRWTAPRQADHRRAARPRRHRRTHQPELRLDRTRSRPRPDRSRGTTTNSADALANLATSLDTIRHRTTRLAADIRLAETRALGPAAGTGPELPTRHPSVSDGSPSVDL